MRIIEIAALKNGAHRNQTGETDTIPEGWAVIPEEMELESFPFGTVAAEERDGVMTVTGWTPGEMPEIGEPAEAEPSTAEILDVLLGVTE